MSLPTKENNYLVVLPFFPGFYESMLSSAIDNAEEMDAEYYAEKEESQKYYPETYQPEHLRIDKGEYAELFFDCTDYHKTHLKVAQLWVESFDWWCKENLGTPEKSFVYESMTSPREYNFETDRVFAWVPVNVIEALFATSAVSNHETLVECIKESFTSRSGFMSFYPNDLETWLEKPLDEWDHNEMMTLVKASIRSSEWFEGTQYSDRNEGDFSMAIYEILFSGNGEDEREVDWKKFEEKVAALRAEKQAEFEATKEEAQP